MAMPTDFWRNEQSLNIFRTKPCQRLAGDGVCRWRSQCQYSHCPEWPRRQSRKHGYSPEICPSLQVNAEGILIGNHCAAGLKCPMAHSKEEVLFHPYLFKTSLCEEHASRTAQKSTRSAKRHRCHRYYCPFAHGPMELRASPLSQEQREHCLKAALDRFPSGDCCLVCTPYWTAQQSEKAEVADVVNLESQFPFLWAEAQQARAPATPVPPAPGLPAPPPMPGSMAAPAARLWEEILSTSGPGISNRVSPSHRWMDSIEASVLTWPFEPLSRVIGPTLDPWGDGPAFIELSVGRSMGAGAKKTFQISDDESPLLAFYSPGAKSSPTRTRELLPRDLLYTML